MRQVVVVGGGVCACARVCVLSFMRVNVIFVLQHPPVPVSALQGSLGGAVLEIIQMIYSSLLGQRLPRVFFLLAALT